jgi:phosphocarrier protein FPr
VAVCGESASDDAAVPLLLGLGVSELSVGPHDVPRVKARVRELDLELCETTAQASLGLDSATDVRELVATKLGPTPHA